MPKTASFDASGVDRARALAANAARRLRYGASLLERDSESIARAGLLLGQVLTSGGRAYVFGNGGSAACATHFAAEFTGRLKKDRRPLPVISLTTDTSALTAIANDYGYEDVFSRQVTALAGPGDLVIGLSTSGTSANVRKAFAAAHQAGATTLGLVGQHDGLGARHTIGVDLPETARVQELHDLVLHEIAQIAEREVVTDLEWDTSACPFPFHLAETDLPAFREWIEATGQSLATTNGVFDLLHSGHAASISEARRSADRLVLLINSDASVRALSKGPERPIRGEQERIADLSRLPAVDHVVVMEDQDPRRLLALLTPTIHAKGAEYAGAPLLEEETVVAGGGRIMYIERVEGFSTTSQVEKSRS
ncbi:SIS domain-containing protein [Brachybacterium massiliense]|uniref:SIS domain-containing protein n=1 Tax=Brachybacterium massiliense TaxID=1755098 RepID=UPI000B3BD30D|nr:SIS domain-containing protein [Brachybacterium massiliense]